MLESAACWLAEIDLYHITGMDGDVFRRFLFLTVLRPARLDLIRIGLAWRQGRRLKHSRARALLCLVSADGQGPGSRKSDVQPCRRVAGSSIWRGFTRRNGRRV